MSPDVPSFADPGLVSDIQSLDKRIEELGLTIWIGGEPTFTDRFSEAPEWLNCALGGNKEQRAMDLLRHFASAFPGAAVLRTLGRQYPGESEPRWSIGLYGRRDGEPAWQGPSDPLLAARSDIPFQPEDLMKTLEAAALRRGWGCRGWVSEVAPRYRMLLHLGGASCQEDAPSERALERPSIHHRAIPDSGLRDLVAEDGYLLIGFDADSDADTGGTDPYLELPQVAAPSDLLALLSAVSEASTAAGLSTLRLMGYPPPVDLRVHWSSLTPDPAVIEANLAPAADLAEFFNVNQQLFEFARKESLWPYRLQYNGRQVDSGGGGQLTIGGPTPLASPFFVEPNLLPRLIRYFNRHPALSYWFATDYIGSGSQAPRCDEGLRELFPELHLALEQLARHDAPGPEAIWSTLAPFLADAGGNSHRSEINIEKLWNPYLGERGQQGLVELRPFQMPPSAAMFSALAALVRALIARLMRYPYDEPLLDWGERLHTRFALPFYLKQDLDAVLRDLDDKGLGLGDTLCRKLLDDSSWELARLEWRGATVRVRRAQEFWPLIGDRTAQRSADSRLVDASTSRRELSISADTPDCLAEFEVRVAGHRLPLQQEAGPPATHLMGLRYRSFMPLQGLHPDVPALQRLDITLLHRPSGKALCLELFEWRPTGGPYAGLPRDRAEASQRRAECLVTREVDAAALPAELPTPQAALSDYCLDLRWLQAISNSYGDPHENQ